MIRLVLTEGPRFPKLAEFYYREVIARVMAAIRGMLRRAVERGELKTDALVRFPQLLAAPGLVAIIWSGLFDRFEPLDVRAHDARPFRPRCSAEEARHERRIASHVLARCAAGARRLRAIRAITGYQGWVEAELIFVSPDEAGRVETLSVREGDAVEKGAPLFTRRSRTAAGRRRHGPGVGHQRRARPSSAPRRCSRPRPARRRRSKMPKPRLRTARGAA